MLKKDEGAKAPKKKESTIKRAFGETSEHSHRLERNIIILLGILLSIATAFICYRMPYGHIALMIIGTIAAGSIPVFIYVIRIQEDIVHETLFKTHKFEEKSPDGTVVKVIEYELIDEINIWRVPHHIFITEYDIVGNHPQLRSNLGANVYIADKFDKDKKIVVMPWNELFSNQRYISHKNTFVELKDFCHDLQLRTLRNEFAQDITVGMSVAKIVTEIERAIFEAPPEYVISRESSTANKFHMSEEDIKTITASMKTNATEALKENGDAPK